MGLFTQDSRTKPPFIEFTALKRLALSLAWLLILMSLGVGWIALPASGQESPVPHIQQAASTPWTPLSPAWRVVVSGDGLYQLAYADLQAAGLPVDTLDPHTLRMYYQGVEIPIQVIGEGDGRFDAGDAILFYGRSQDALYEDGLLLTNRYTGASIYWLTYGGVNGLRMSSRLQATGGSTAAAFPHPMRMEINRWYQSAYPEQEYADHWYWEMIRAQGVNQIGATSYDFQVQNLPAGGYTATLTITLLGYNTGAHHLRLYMNGVQIWDDPNGWSEYAYYSATTTFSQSLLQEGVNTLRVELVNDTGKAYDQAYVNWFRLTYHDGLVAEEDHLDFRAPAAGTWTYRVSGFSQNAIALYDISDFMAPVQITGASIEGAGPYTLTFADASTNQSRYLALTPAARLSPDAIEPVTPLTSAFTPDDLLDATNRADYILITHADFWDEAQRLAQHRSRDFAVALIDVQAIYDQFNGGMMSAEAIRDFLAYAYANWTPPAPQFVTLLGDGSYDMRGYGNTFATYIPPYLALVDPVLGETAADNRFVTIVGNDPIPDMAIGRLPANSPDEAQAMVDKIITYETGCPCGQWSYQTIFVADDLEGGGGNFYELSDQVADGYDDPPTNTVKYVPETYQIEKIYLGLTCDEDNPATADECPTQLAASLNITGALFVSYVGHAAKTYWAQEHMWDQVDVAGLTNGPCLPIMLTMACYDGFFQDPAQEAMGEYQVRLPQHGAVASWSSSGVGLASGHDILERGMMLALFQEQIPRLGAAAVYAKNYLWQESGDRYLDVIETYTLLGDAALQPKTESVCQDAPTAVVFSRLQAAPASAAVRLTWETADEQGLAAFEVWRRPADSHAPFQAITPLPIFARGVPNLYQRFDRDVEPGVSYAYRLRAIHLDGSETWHDLGVAAPRFRDIAP